MPNTSALTKDLSLRVVGCLQHGPQRFSEIERKSRATNPVALSSVLKKLCRDGIINRTVKTLGPPARVEYSLTDIGADLVEPARSMTNWIDQYQEKIATARQQSHEVEAFERAQAALHASMEDTQ
jgi:DNA-binding HxlR family transcriptional regulator